MNYFHDCPCDECRKAFGLPLMYVEEIFVTSAQPGPSTPEPVAPAQEPSYLNKPKQHGEIKIRKPPSCLVAMVGPVGDAI